MGRTLLAEAEFSNATGLVRLLLQLGAYVDPRSMFGSTPFSQACSKAKTLEEVARILLQWGADTTVTREAGFLANMARNTGNPKLAALLETPLGGRRCELVGLASRTDLNGKTVIVTRYMPSVERYVVEVELTDERVKVRPANLVRRDKTAKDMVGKIYGYHGKGSRGENLFEENLLLGSTEDEEFVASARAQQRPAA
jgi:hypothetical protein